MTTTICLLCREPMGDAASAVRGLNVHQSCHEQELFELSRDNTPDYDGQDDGPQSQAESDADALDRCYAETHHADAEIPF
jgi:hypothetical protein